MSERERERERERVRERGLGGQRQRKEARVKEREHCTHNVQAVPHSHNINNTYLTVVGVHDLHCIRLPHTHPHSSHSLQFTLIGRQL